MKGSNLGMRGWYEITHPRHEDFTKRSAEDLWDSADKVEAAYRRWQSGGITKTLYESISKSEALNYHPLALLWRLILRNYFDLLKAFRYDWAHTLLQESPMHVEMHRNLP